MSKFRSTSLIAGTTMALALASAVSAQALEVSQVQLGVLDSGGSSCPRDAKVTAWAHTNGPGTVKFVIRNDSGGKTGELTANAVKGAAGNFLATYTHHFKITTDVDIKYMAEAIGHGKISNWVTLTSKCGPQPRTTTKTQAGPKPKGKHISELEKDPKPTGDGKPLPPQGKPLPSEGKPLPSGEGKPIPSGGKPLAECKPMLSVTRKLAVTRTGGIATAQAAWHTAALAGYGAAYGRWSNAKDQNASCDRKGLTFDCTVKARPCKD